MTTAEQPQRIPTLYVDCDNTLINWKRSYSLRGDQLWEVNWAVVAAIERWQATGGNVVIWSEKGSDYATTWARRAAPHLGLVADRKDSGRPVAGDVAIDDVTLGTNCVCYRPSECMLIAPVLTV